MHSPRDPGAAKVILRFAAVIVQQYRLAEAGELTIDRRKRCQEKGRVRRREDMDDVCAAKLTDEQWPVAQLRDDRAQYLICSSRSNGLGGIGLIGTIHASTSASFSQPFSSRLACTAWPPRMRSEATTMATRRRRGGVGRHTAGPIVDLSRCKRDDLSGSRNAVRRSGRYAGSSVFERQRRLSASAIYAIVNSMTAVIDFVARRAAIASHRFRPRARTNRKNISATRRESGPSTRRSSASKRDSQACRTQ